LGKVILFGINYALINSAIKEKNVNSSYENFIIGFHSMCHLFVLHKKYCELPGNTCSRLHLY